MTCCITAGFLFGQGKYKFFKKILLRKRFHSTRMETGIEKRVSKKVTMELQEQIREASTDLFREKGLKFTMEDVARQMHVAKKTIYKYYQSKEDLLMDLVKTGFAAIQECKQKVLDSNLPMKEKIAKVLIEMPENYKTLDFRQLSGIGSKYPTVAAEIAMNLGSEWEPIFALLEEGIRSGRVNSVSLPVLKQIVTASIDRFLYSDELKRDGITYQEALEYMVEILMKGVWNDSAQ